MCSAPNAIHRKHHDVRGSAERDRSRFSRVIGRAWHGRAGSVERQAARRGSRGDPLHVNDQWKHRPPRALRKPAEPPPAAPHAVDRRMADVRPEPAKQPDPETAPTTADTSKLGRFIMRYHTFLSSFVIGVAGLIATSIWQFRQSETTRNQAGRSRRSPDRRGEQLEDHARRYPVEEPRRARVDRRRHGVASATACCCR